MGSLQNINSIDDGLVFIALLALLILHQALNFVGKRVGEWYDHRKGNGLQGTIKNLQRAIESLESKVADNPPYPPCHYDPQHFERIKRIEDDVSFTRESQEEQRRQIDSGKFSCKIKGEHLRTIQRVDDRLNSGEAL